MPGGLVETAGLIYSNVALRASGMLTFCVRRGVRRVDYPVDQRLTPVGYMASTGSLILQRIVFV